MDKKILFANQSSGSLMIDIVNTFARSGEYNKVILFTGEINIRPSVPDNNVSIIKTKRYNNKGGINRMISWIIAFLHLLLFALTKRNYLFFLVSNPPLNIFIPLLTRCKFRYLVYDIYPDTFVAQGYWSCNSIINRWWKKCNKNAFQKAERIYTISEDMKNVLSNYAPRDKIEVIYNWCHSVETVAKNDNPFLKKYNLQDKFIVLYSGNMGMTHDLDVLVDVANILNNEKQLVFLFIGDGGKKKIVEDKIKKYGLSNCLVLPFQPNNMLPFTMGGADLGVITMDNGSTALSIPSKTQRFLSCGIPLLCIADPQSELAQIVEKNKVGRCFTKDDLAGMGSFIKQLMDGETKESMHKNALRVSKNFSPENSKRFL